MLGGGKRARSAARGAGRRGVSGLGGEARPGLGEGPLRIQMRPLCSWRRHRRRTPEGVRAAARGPRRSPPTRGGRGGGVGETRGGLGCGPLPPPTDGIAPCGFRTPLVRLFPDRGRMGTDSEKRKLFKARFLHPNQNRFAESAGEKTCPGNLGHLFYWVN